MDTHEHIVRSYEEELSSLNNKIAKMGGLAEQVLGQSIDALEGRDPDLAAATIQQDEAIDELETEIEEQAIVGEHSRLRRTLGSDIDHPLELREVIDQRRWILGGRDDVEVAESLLPAACAARLRHLHRGRVLTENGDDRKERAEPVT